MESTLESVRSFPETTPRFGKCFKKLKKHNQNDLELSQIVKVIKNFIVIFQHLRGKQTPYNDYTNSKEPLEL